LAKGNFGEEWTPPPFWAGAWHLAGNASIEKNGWSLGAKRTLSAERQLKATVENTR